MSKTTNKFSPEGRPRAVRLILDHGKDHPSRWPAEKDRGKPVRATVSSALPPEAGKRYDDMLGAPARAACLKHNGPRKNRGGSQASAVQQEGTQCN